MEWGSHTKAETWCRQLGGQVTLIQSDERMNRGRERTEDQELEQREQEEGVGVGGCLVTDD